MFQNKFNYNKKIYLEIIDNTIIDYRINILIPKFNLFKSQQISYDIYYNIYNKKLFDLYKLYNYIYNLNEL